MKRLVALLTTMVLLFGAIPIGFADTYNTWRLDYGEDEFGDPQYWNYYLWIQTMALVSKASVGEIGVVQIAMDGFTGHILLMEITSSGTKKIVTEKYSNYQVSIKDSAGNKSRYNCKRESNGSWMEFPNYQVLFDLFASGEEVHFVIAPVDSTKDSFSFSIKPTNSFLGEFPLSYGNFSDGLATCGHSDGKEGYIDKTGKLVIPCEWDSAGTFDEGLASVTQNGKAGYIDKTGKLVIPCEWDSAGFFTEGLARVKQNGKWGYIDKTGKLVIPCEWDSGWSFAEGLALVKQNGKYGYIDKTGKLVIPCEWDSAGSFAEGLAYVKQNGKYGYIDRTGKLVIPCEWDSVWPFTEGLACVQQKGKWGYIDKTGKLVIPCEWDSASSFADELAPVEQNGKYGYIDKSGKLVIPCEWDSAMSFNEGLALVYQNGKWGYIDKTGKLVIPCEWDSARAFTEGVAISERQGRKYLIDIATGHSTLLPYQYNNLRSPSLSYNVIETQETPEPSVSYNPLKQGDKGNDVLDMKKRMQELGYFSAGASFSNAYNSTTTERVKLFQKANGLKQTGVADEATLTLLYSDDAKKNPY